MSTFLISYDLNKPGQDYDDLISELKKFTTRWHRLDSTWIVVSDLKCAQIRDNLKVHIDSNDELLVVKLCGVGSWCGFDESGSKWLMDNI